ncbi:MAG: hypothetical protein ACOZAG_01470 [Patescibacteria group bacterium]
MKASPTLTADLRRGDETQVLLKLQQDGVTPDDYAEIAVNEAMRAEVVAAIQKHRMFTPPEEQVKNLLRLNGLLWCDPAITTETLAALGLPPKCPPSDEHHLYAVVLLYETGDALQTLERNWQACVAVHGEERTWKWDGLVFSPKGVRPREGAKPRQPGLRWVVAELGRAYQGMRVRDARVALSAEESAGMGQELPLIAALHPRWATSMNGGTIPFVDAPDLEVAPRGEGEFNCAPCLFFSRGGGRVRLGAGDVGDPLLRCGSGSLQ